MGSYDKARRQQIDPNKVRWHHNDLNEKAVRHYMKHPNKPFDGSSGEVYIEIGKGGRMYGANGRHRAEAARRTGRKFDAQVVHNPQRDAAFSNPGCLGMVMMLAVCMLVAVVATVSWLS